MVAQVLRNVFSDKLSTKYRGIIQNLANKSPIPIRHFDFKFDPESLDIKFLMQKEWATAYFAALSIFLTYGEDLVIETARYHRDFIDDPILKQRLTSLIGQEAIHSKLHNEYNEIMIPNDVPVRLYRFLAEQVFNYTFLKFPQPLKLSLMAGIEHFTAVLAEFGMKHEYIFQYSDDEKACALWMWHMLEESEHKDIAYDTYQVLSGNYALRILGFFLAFITIGVGVGAGGLFLPFFRRPSNLINLSFWKEAGASWSVLFSLKDGMFGSTLPHIFDYLRPDFHPNDHDTTAYLEYYKERLLNPETGLLSPYFLKEFVPPVRAATA
ncbi:metal-dependent hydrolase [Acinetobacter sp. C26M]|uniref:metal-dependent hydrolase n=1 Tax=unclassified Acinetobacter TaxID=196816 RepID=UPI00203724BD|nr:MULTISPECIES: metal-dependent hydrolase [unclassified Acinetobacter]USA47884.1 metal-dependent hydrolase [Acinetobacter sp. C26M]USA51364.1 metal-dependent hydrolase [Acinetobacter sp. C26G]